MKYIYTFVMFFLSTPLFAQLEMEYSNWVFSSGCGLKFDKNNKVTKFETSFNQNPHKYSSASSISDSTGRLLFACDAEYLFSYNEFYGVKKTKINGNYNAVQGNQILKLSNNKYILLLIGDTTNINEVDKKLNFHFYIFEMDNNDSLRIVQNDKIVRKEIGDGMSTYYNENDSTYTIALTNVDGDSLLLYKINNIGVIKRISEQLINPKPYFRKYTSHIVKFSPNGKLIAIAITSNPLINPIEPKIYLFRLSNEVISSKVVITNFNSEISKAQHYINSIEFSANSNFLYCAGSFFICDFYQYDLRKYNEMEINNSLFYFINKQSGSICGISWEYSPAGLQLGINDKLYISSMNHNAKVYNIEYFDLFSTENVIHLADKPNRIGDSMDIKYLVYKYSNRSYTYALPSMPANANFQKLNTQSISSNSPVCFLDTIRLNATFDVDTSKIDCYWIGPNGFASNSKNPKFDYYSESQNGWYYLRAVHNVSDFEKIDSVLVQNNPINKIKIQHDKALNLCQGDIVKLYTNIVSPDIEWFVNNTFAIKGKDLLIDSSCKVNVKFVDNAGCVSHDTINITVLPKPKAEIGFLGSLSLCQGDSVKLFIKDKLAIVDYVWIVNNQVVNANTIIAKTPQKYKLIARNKTLIGCTDSTEIEVTEQAKEKLVINGIKSFCEGDSTKLEISKAYPGVQFEWNTGKQTNSIIVSKAGTYWCRATNNNCLTADTIQVSVNPKPIINITGDTIICKNATGVLTLNGSYTSCTWSNGETTPTITITKAGIYSAQAENDFGCKSKAQIVVKEISNNIDLSKFQDIDFGKTKTNESITKELDITGINPNNIKLLNNTDFTFVRNGNKLEITYKAAKKGSSEDTLFITIDNPCQETIALKLKAEAEGEQIITLKVADIEVLAGDTDVPLPITYKLNDNITLPQTITWTAKLNYKTAIYYPDIVGDVQSANRKIDIIISGTKTLTKKEDTLTIIKGKTYIADTIFTKVKFIDFTVNPDFTIIKEDGSIKITGLCVPNLRGIEFFTPTTMIIKPNPTSGEVDIEFTSEENGETKLKLFNSAGAEVLTDSKNKKDKTITFHFDKLDLPNGIYQAQIEQSGKIVQSTSLVIEK